MSFEYYTNWWIKSKKDLEDLTQRDENIGKKFKPINDRSLANALVGGLYAKYCMLVQDLCACVDQMAQPQRRISVKKLVDSACIRLNELNDELRKISISEYHYIDGSLIELKLIPYDIEILHPCLFHHRPVQIEEMVQRIKNGEKIFIPPVPTIAAASSTDIKPEKSVLFAGETHKTTSNIRPASKAPLSSILLQSTTLEDSLENIGGREKRRTSAGSFMARLSRQMSGYLVDLSPEELAERARQAKLKQSLIMVQTAERGRQDRVYFFEKMVKLENAKALVTTRVLVLYCMRQRVRYAHVRIVSKMISQRVLAWTKEILTILYVQKTPNK